MHLEKFVTKCIPFSLDAVRFGLMVGGANVTNSPTITYTRKWMFNQSNYNYRIKVEIPDLRYLHDETIPYFHSGPFGPNIISIVRDDPYFVLSENDPDTVKIHVSVSVLSNGKYLESLPYQYSIDVKTSDLKTNSE